MAPSASIATRDGRRISLEAQTLRDFSGALSGELLDHRDPGYQAARKLWNGMIDKHPALIARCAGTADVALAVEFARKHDLLVAVRGRGHNVAGHALVDDGLVIDVSRMTRVEVDRTRKTARVEPGADWGMLDTETQKFGLVTPGGQVSTTGVAGFTLGGGMGYLRRKWGLACDNLVSLEIVTADGKVLNVSETEHSDLFWALRGGGGNFGVVTAFEFQLHELGPDVYAAVTVYPLSEGRRVLRRWRDYLARSPDEVTSDLFMWSMPPLPEVPKQHHGAPVIIAEGLYAGPPGEAEVPLSALRELGTPLVDLSGVRRYVEFQSETDAMFPNGLQYYWKSLFVNELSDPVIECSVELAEKRPSPKTLLALRSLGGAIAQVPEHATAYANRSAAFNISLDCTWEFPGQNQRMITWTRAGWQRLKDMTGGGIYVNFAGLGEDNDQLARSAFGANHTRLQEVKQRYDPHNLFRGNINIPPRPSIDGRDRVDEASWESFPASDPPATNPGSIGGSY